MFVASVPEWIAKYQFSPVMYIIVCQQVLLPSSNTMFEKLCCKDTQSWSFFPSSNTENLPPEVWKYKFPKKLFLAPKKLTPPKIYMER